MTVVAMVEGKGEACDHLSRLPNHNPHLPKNKQKQYALAATVGSGDDGVIGGQVRAISYKIRQK